MDVASLGIMGVNVVMAGISMFAAEVTKECAKPTVRFAFEKLTERVRAILGVPKLPPSEIPAELLRDERIAGDPEVARLTEEFIGSYSSIRRARIVARVLVGAKVLWVDDHPENNTNEKRTLEDFGVQVDQVRSTAEAMNRLLGRSFDLILSDMDRDGRSDAGMELLCTLRSSDCPIPLVFYVGEVDPNRGVPVGASGIADQPEPLLHLVLDVLERQRI
jgi:CheY-like chemotaxis protein